MTVIFCSTKLLLLLFFKVDGDDHFYNFLKSVALQNIWLENFRKSVVKHSKINKLNISKARFGYKGPGDSQRAAAVREPTL